MSRYFTIYKPFQVLTQFTSQTGKSTLADYFKVPGNVYPVGRLDYDSEGLLILTDDATINHRLLHPLHKHEREYWVQVEGQVTEKAVADLSKGVSISIDGKVHKTQPAKASIFIADPQVPERNPPIRFRKNIPTSWLSLSLTEGKNRQVRRMTAKVGFATLRLIRYRIENLTLDGLQPGQMKEWKQHEIYKALFNE
jgi:23S rRNA pseudouridine2457 synthase